MKIFLVLCFIYLTSNVCFGWKLITWDCSKLTASFKIEKHNLENKSWDCCLKSIAPPDVYGELILYHDDNEYSEELWIKPNKYKFTATFFAKRKITLSPGDKIVINLEDDDSVRGIGTPEHIDTITLYVTGYEFEGKGELNLASVKIKCEK